MRTFYALTLGVITLSIGLCALPSLARAQDSSKAQHQPVVVELFTSQGCSSCPPAETLVTELAHQDPNLIVLTFHVDYWDRLGWKDPYGSPLWSTRQSTYATALRDRRIYTPQAIVQGRAHTVGSDRESLMEHIQTARAKSSKVSWAIHIKPTAEDGWYIEASANTHGTMLPLSTRVVAVLTDPQGDTTRISRGENTGRSLHNTHTVHTLRSITPTRTGSLLHAAWSWAPPKNLPQGRGQLVLFLQDTKTMEVYHATKKRLKKTTSPSAK